MADRAPKDGETHGGEVHPSHRSVGKISVHSIPSSPETPTVDLGGPPSFAIPAEPGLSTDQQFLLRACINVGGCGEIWEAIQTSLHRVVAVKRVYISDEESATSSEQDRKREEEWLRWQFRQEALITAQLDHPNILPVYDLGLDASGTPVLAMKLVRGTPWHQLLRHDMEVLPYDDYLDRHLPTMIELARAVAFAHSRQIVHRDLKPSQVMVGEFGEVLLMDWGLAVYVGAADDPRLPDNLSDLLATPLTAASPAGTPALMAPEQTRETAEGISPRTDIYQLGGTLYYILTGTYPHEAPTPEGAMQQAKRGIVDPPEVRSPELPIPPELSELAMRALTHDPGERPQSAEMFVHTIGSFLKVSANRRTSRKFVKEARALLEEIEQATAAQPPARSSRRNREGTVTIYERYSEALSLLDRARGIWFLNPDIPQLETRLLTGYGKIALDQQDFTLARVMVDRLHDPTVVGNLRSDIDRQEETERRHGMQRRLAIASAAVLTVILLAVTGVYSMIQVETNRALSAERESSLEMLRQRTEAEQIAVRQRALADTARERAEELQRIAEAAQRDAEQLHYYSTIGFAASSFEQGRGQLTRQILLEDAPVEFRGWEWGFLLNRLYPEMMTLQNEEQIFHAEYSPGADLIATGDMNHIALWDASTGARIWRTRTNERLIWEVAFSPDGHTIAGVSFDRTVVVLDAETGDIRHRLEGHTDILRSVSFSADSRRIVTAGGDRTLRFWDVETGEALALVEDHGHTIYSARFSSDGRHLVTSGLDGTCVIRDAETGEPIHTLPSRGSTLLSTDFNADGTLVVAANTMGWIGVIDVETGEVIEEHQNKGLYTHNARFLPGDARIVTTDDQGFARVIDRETGEEVFAFLADDPMWKVRVHPDGDRIMTTSRRSVRVTSLRSARGIVPVETAVTPEQWRETAHRFSVYGLPNQRHLDWLERDAQWDVPQGWSLADIGHLTVAVQSRFARLSPDGAASARIDRPTLVGEVRDTNTGEVLYEPSFDNLITLEFNHDGSLLAFAAMSDRIELIDTSTWSPVAEINLSDLAEESEPYGVPINNLAFSPDGRLLAIGCLGGRVVLHDLQANERVRVIEEPAGVGISVAFSPDGRLLAAGGTNDDAMVWDVETGEMLAHLIGHQRTIYSIEFSPDMQRVLTASSDMTVKLWDIETGRELLSVHDAEQFRSRQPLGASFTPDGLTILVPISNGELLAFDALPWRLRDYPGPEDLEFGQRLELYIRQTRLNPDVTLADVLPSSAE